MPSRVTELVSTEQLLEPRTRVRLSHQHFHLKASLKGEEKGQVEGRKDMEIAGPNRREKKVLLQSCRGTYEVSLGATHTFSISGCVDFPKDQQRGLLEAPQTSPAPTPLFWSKYKFWDWVVIFR